MGELIQTTEILRHGAIAQNDSYTGSAIDLRKIELEGSFSLHTIHVGGTITASILVSSTEKGTFVVPDTPIVILNAVAAGTHFAPFTPPLAPFMKIVLTETNTGACTSMDCWLNYK